MICSLLTQASVCSHGVVPLQTTEPLTPIHARGVVYPRKISVHPNQPQITKATDLDEVCFFFALFDAYTLIFHPLYGIIFDRVFFRRKITALLCCEYG